MYRMSLEGSFSCSWHHVVCVDTVELIGTYNDEDIYLFDSSHSEGAEHKHKYSGHRNSATGTAASSVVLSGSRLI